MLRVLNNVEVQGTEGGIFNCEFRAQVTERNERVLLRSCKVSQRRWAGLDASGCRISKAAVSWYRCNQIEHTVVGNHTSHMAQNMPV